jgi:hypothetical protein
LIHKRQKRRKCTLALLEHPSLWSRSLSN